MILGGLVGVSTIIIVLLIVLIILLITKAYRKSPPDQALVVTGLGQEKYVIGNSAFVIPFFQRVDKLNLGVVQCVLHTPAAIPTKDAILITCKAVANFQISADPELIKVAAKNYLNKDKEEMERDVSEVLMGKIREVIGQMEIVELMRNRDEFNQKVFDNSKEDMNHLGLELTTFNIQDFDDSEDVIKNMGADQSAQIRRDAQFARISADQEVAIRQNELDLKEAELKKTADKAKAEAEMVYDTTKAEATRQLKIAEQEAEIAAEEKRIELKEKEVAVKERELEANVKKQADANRYEAEQQAEANLFTIQKKAEAELVTQQKKAEAELFSAQKDAEATKTKAEAEAEAEKRRGEGEAARITAIGKADGEAEKARGAGEAARIESVGKAEGEAEKAKGLGVAAATKEQIAAYAEMKGTNYLADRYIGIMPEMARAVSEPLSAIDNLTMYGEGNAASLVEETTKITSQVNAGLSEGLGIDLKSVLSGLVGGVAASKMSSNPAPVIPAGLELPESLGDVADKLLNSQDAEESEEEDEEQ